MGELLDCDFVEVQNQLVVIGCDLSDLVVLEDNDTAKDQNTDE
jgi:hypothetical protein